jgi:hypothetical protein
MKTTPHLLEMLKSRRGSEALLVGDALAAVIDDLEELRRLERTWNAGLQKLEAARDDSTPRGCPFDEALLPESPL